MTPWLCSRGALSSLFSTLPVTCENEWQAYSWERLYKIHTLIANSPSPWRFAMILSKSWVYLFVLHLLLFPVPLGVESRKNKGSIDWPASVKGAVSWGPVTSSGTLGMGGVIIWFPIGTHLDKLVTLKDNRIKIQNVLDKKEPRAKTNKVKFNSGKCCQLIQCRTKRIWVGRHLWERFVGEGAEWWGVDLVHCQTWTCLTLK